MMIAFRSLLLASSALFALWSLAACPTVPVGEGEGEGEGDPRDPIDVGDPPFGYETTPGNGVPAEAPCYTDQWWVFGNLESETMNPGMSCIDCHTREREGPVFSYMGTVMGGLDDADTCRGIPEVQVDILDENDDVIDTVFTNAAGNFMGDVLPSLPAYRVRLTFDGRTSEMVGLQTDGDCMRCHTDNGAEGAPGRITAP